MEQQEVRSPGLLRRITLQNGEIFFEAFWRNEVYQLRWPRAGEASVSKQGRLLRFEQKPAARSISTQILRRIVMAYASSLRGREALHATTLERNGRAIALIGASGEGKSTLAAYLLKNDSSIRLLSDDLLYLKMIKGKAWVMLSKEAPRLKLSRETFLRFGFNGRDGYGTQFDPNLEKEIILLPSGESHRRLVPLVAIVQLNRNSSGLRLEKIKGAKAALTLLANIYNEILRPPRVLKNQFELCATLGRLVPIGKLSFPSGFKALPTIAHRMNRIWMA